MRLSFRARLTYLAHLLKCTLRQDHLDMVPALRAFLPDDAVILDIGAHGGQFTKLFAKYARRGHVHAFEPSGYARSILSAAVTFNRLRNVTIVPFAAADSAATGELHLPLKRSGSVGYGLSHFGPMSADRRYLVEEVRQTTLDRYVADNAITRVDFIKADIEGWEGRMLAGAAGILARHKPALLLEVSESNLARAGDSVATVWEQMLSAGYGGYLFDPARQNFARVEPGGVGDVFFLQPHHLKRPQA